ncbi:hypothetical protein ECC02_008887 [Trypanosoma cruzi]|uniref:Uncharacterized protein n=1 Tax=Trypanosoma cruzi TaxID=5693 RepID=A0A7J6XVA4_TRYCR|nr:hypothetical protein ECC02_008887 [Trypanosoma cruzi]
MSCPVLSAAFLLATFLFCKCVCAYMHLCMYIYLYLSIYIYYLFTFAPFQIESFSTFIFILISLPLFHAAAFFFFFVFIFFYSFLFFIWAFFSSTFMWLYKEKKKKGLRSNEPHMTTIKEETLDRLLRENRRIQSYVRSLIEAIEVRRVLTDNVLFALMRREAAQRQPNRNELLRADVDLWFKFCCGSQMYAPASLMRPPWYCHAFAPNFRWSHRAKRLMKRQVELLGLDNWEEGNSAQWQVVANAVNYDSSSTRSVDGFQCFLQYYQEVIASPDPFSSTEDNLIDMHDPVSGRWGKLVDDILQRIGCRRTVFQVAERYRKLKRELYEYNCLLYNTDWVKIEALLRSNATPEAELFLECSCRLNMGRKIPWLTEDSIRRTFMWYQATRVSGDALMLRNIYAVLLSNGDYFSSREAREIGVRLLGCDPLDLREAIARARWRYAQISEEVAAARLSSSVPEIKERVLAKVLRWHDSVYASDFFRLSINLFGQRDGALACFRISRDYERRRRKTAPHGRLQLL